MKGVKEWFSADSKSLSKALIIISTLIFIVINIVINIITILSNSALIYWMAAPLLALPVVLLILKTGKVGFWKLISFVYIFLLLIYAVLYHLIPHYVMPAINEEKKRELENLVKDIVGDASNDVDKAYRLYEWVRDYLINIRTHKALEVLDIDNYIILLKRAPFICIRMRGEDYPLWPLASRCGACMEYALLYRELAAAANLTVRSVHNPGEDHNWDEVLINGDWIVVDPSWPMFNVSPNFYDQRPYYGRYINISFVYATYPNNTKVVLTNRYTNTGALVIKVTRTDDEIINNITVRIRSHNYLEGGLLIRGLECVVDLEEICQVELGGGNYIITAVATSGSTVYRGEAGVKVIEGERAEVTIKLQKSIPDLTVIYIILHETTEFYQILLMLYGFILLLLSSLVLRNVI